MIAAETESMAEAKMMRAVVFHGPHSVTVEQRAIPTIQEDGDIIVEVGYSALCGRLVGSACSSPSW